MAYQNLTSVADTNVLIDSLCTFLGANGWTVDRNSVTSGARTATVHVAGVSDYVHLYSASTTATEIRGRISIGYTSGAAYTAQPRQMSYDMRTNLVGPFPNVYMFCDGAAVHVVIQIAGVIEFRHVCFGVLDKVGAYTGGTYLDGSYRGPDYRGDIQGAYHHAPFLVGPKSSGDSAPYSGAVRADITADSVVDGYYTPGMSTAYSACAWTGFSSWYDESTLGKISGGGDANSFDGRSVFQPLQVFIGRAGTTVHFSPIGEVRNTQGCNMTKFSPAQEVVVGSDTYVMFPAFKRSMTQAVGVTSELGSHTLGYAVKKVT